MSAVEKIHQLNFEFFSEIQPKSKFGVDSSQLEAVCIKIADKLNTLAYGDLGQAVVTSNFHHDEQIHKIIDQHTAGLAAELRKRILDEYFQWGPLEALINDETITEILVNSKDAIFYERDGRLLRHCDSFLSTVNYRNFVQRLSRWAEIQASLDCPFADGSFKSFRIHLALYPACATDATVSIRRHPKNPWTMSELQRSGWGTADQLRCLSDLVKKRKNFLVVGPTGAGKTSVLNACLQSVLPDDRAVIIEDTSEITSPNPLSIKLLTRRDNNRILRDIDQAELVKQSLRMRPDRIDSARQALIRLEMLIQLGAPHWNLQAVRSLVLMSIQSIVVVGKTESGQRKLDGIYKLASLEDVGFLLEKQI